MYIAIDGGGTKTDYILLNDNKEIIDSCQGSGINHDLLQAGWSDSEKILEQSIKKLLTRNQRQLSEVKDLVAGLSGLDTEADLKEIEHYFKKIGMKKFLVLNDGYLSIKSETDSGHGVAYNCGTGVCCARIDECGNMKKTAGLDEWSGDAGGGNWIKVNIFRHVYQTVIIEGKDSPMVQAYKKQFGIDSEQDIIESWNKLKDGTRFPKVSADTISLLFSQLENDDPYSLKLVHEMTACAKKNIQAVLTNAAFANKQIPVVLTGSINTKAANNKYLEMLKNSIQTIPGYDFKFIIASKKPVHGSIRWLKERNPSK